MYAFGSKKYRLRREVAQQAYSKIIRLMVISDWLARATGTDRDIRYIPSRLMHRLYSGIVWNTYGVIL